MKKITFIALLFTFILPASNASAASYRVAHTATLSWTASYNISTKGDKITKVSNVSAHAITGTISSKKIVYNSSNKVTLQMIKSLAGIKYKINLSATMKNNKLFVSTN